jgi:prevent-host-death family protein
MIRQIPAGKFKATCLALLDEVQQNRQEILITKRGKPVARLVPVDSAPREIFGRMKGTIEILGRYRFTHRGNMGCRTVTDPRCRRC